MLFVRDQEADPVDNDLKKKLYLQDYLRLGPVSENNDRTESLLVVPIALLQSRTNVSSESTHSFGESRLQPTDGEKESKTANTSVVDNSLAWPEHT